MSRGKHLFKERELARNFVGLRRKLEFADFTARVTPTGAIEIETRPPITEPTTTDDADEWRVE